MAAMPAAIDAPAPPDEPPQVIALVPWVLRQPVQRIVGKSAHRELRRVGHADDDRTRLFQVGCHRRIARRDVVLEADNAIGVGLPLDVDVDLDGDRHAVQLAEWRTLRLARSAARAASMACALRSTTTALIAAIGGAHPVDMRLHYLLGRNLSIADRVCGLHGGPLPDW